MLNPAPDQNEAAIATFQGEPITGGVLWWNGINLAKQKVDFVIANGFGGFMVYEVGTDKLQDPRSLLEVIYQGVLHMNVFPPLAQKTAVAPVKVGYTDANGVFVALPGYACTAEIFIGPDDQHKVATSGPIAFTSGSGAVNVSMPIKMPAVGGDYKVFIDVVYQGALIVAFEATDHVIVLEGTIGPPVWS